MEVEESILQAKVNAYKEANPAASSGVSDEYVEKSVASDPQVAAAMQSIADKKATAQSVCQQSGTRDGRTGLSAAAAQVAEEEQAVEAHKAALKTQSRRRLVAERLQHSMRAAFTTDGTPDCQRHESASAAAIRDGTSNRKQSTGDTVTFDSSKKSWHGKKHVVALMSERIVQLETEKDAPSGVNEIDAGQRSPKPVKSCPT